MNDKIIYVLFKGMYSERSVEGVYDTKELAEAAIELQFSKLRQDDWYIKSSDDQIRRELQIEEYHLNAPPGCSAIWYVCYRTTPDMWDVWPTQFPEDYDVHRRLDNHKDVAYSVIVRAKTEEQALKAGTEKIMQFIALEVT